jgi:hypothetical protein
MSHRKYRRPGGQDSSGSTPVQLGRIAPGKRTTTEALASQVRARPAASKAGGSRAGESSPAPRAMVGAGYGSPIPSLTQIAAATTT